MSNPTSTVAEETGPMRHFRIGRRTLLQSLATGMGATVFATGASAQHVHPVAAQAATPAVPAAESALLFLDQHSFDTLALLGEQIVPGSRAIGTAQFLDRLLSVETTETQKYFTQALGAFEREAREAHAKPWKALTADEATALLTKISTLPDSDARRRAFDGLKGAVAETYYSSEAGKLELGWNRSVAFAPPASCEA